MPQDTNPDPMARLYAALAKASGDARGVEKDSKNSFHKYSYASAESIIREAKDCLSRHGLALFPSRSDVEQRGEQLVFRRTWTLAHEGGGTLTLEQVPWPIVPDKGRPIDKAVAGADTASLGYFLRDLLQIPRVDEGDDMDHDSRDRGRDRDRGAHDERPDPRAEPASQEQRQTITAAFASLGVARADMKAAVAKIAGHEDTLTQDEAERVITVLDERLANRNAANGQPGLPGVPAAQPQPDDR